MFNVKFFVQIGLVLQSLAWTSAGASADSKTCYYPDGSDSRGTPCRSDQAVSPCCGPGFVCLSNGLCSPGPDVRKSYQYDFYRSSCTDSSWNSTDCPHICTGDKDNLNGGQGLTTCGSNDSFCCPQKSNCCDDSQNVFQLSVGNAITTVPYTTASSTGASGADASTTASTTFPSVASSTVASAPAQATPAPSSGLSKGAKIGTGVGIGLGGLVLVGALVAFFCLRRKGRQRRPRSAQPISAVELSEEKVLPELPNDTKTQELPGTESSKELPLGQQRTVYSELPSESSRSYSKNSWSPGSQHHTSSEKPTTLVEADSG